MREERNIKRNAVKTRPLLFFGGNYERECLSRETNQED